MAKYNLGKVSFETCWPAVYPFWGSPTCLQGHLHCLIIKFIQLSIPPPPPPLVSVFLLGLHWFQCDWCCGFGQGCHGYLCGVFTALGSPTHHQAPYPQAHLSITQNWGEKGKVLWWRCGSVVFIWGKTDFKKPGLDHMSQREKYSIEKENEKECVSCRSQVRVVFDCQGME